MSYRQEWPLIRVSEVCELIVDCVNKTAPTVDYPTPFRMIRTTNVRDGFVDVQNCKYVNEETYQKWTRRATVQDADVILTREAPIGEVGLVRGNDTVFLGQRLMQYRANRKVLSPRYLMYAFLSPALQDQFRAHEGSGSVVSHIRVGDCSLFEIPLPPLQEQEKIAELLSTLDERRLLLKRTGRTLESIASAIFKSWFIDFDPVQAKSEGLMPERMDSDTAVLFPDHFDISSSTRVPQGWYVGTVGENFVLIMGQSPPGGTYNQGGQGLPFYQGRADFGLRFPTARVFCTDPTRLARPGDTLVSVRAPVGDVNVALEECCIGRGVAAVRHEVAPSFAYYAMRNLSSEFSKFEGEGTVFGSINKKQFETLPLVIPPPSIIAAFDRLVAPIDARIRVNELQSRYLSELRNELLPRLISGQLRIPDAEQALEEAL